MVYRCSYVWHHDYLNSFLYSTTAVGGAYAIVCHLPSMLKLLCFVDYSWKVSPLFLPFVIQD